MTHKISSRLTGAAALERLARAASDRGIELLSTQWQNQTGEYLFSCANRHQFLCRGSVMLRGKANCGECERAEVRRRFFDTLQLQRLVCEDAGFLGLNVRHRFVCPLGHRWQTRAQRIIEGPGCPRCAANRRSVLCTASEGLKRLQAAAAAHGGRCLEDQYTGMRAGYTWECARGHQWRAGARAVIAGKWCHVCFVLIHGKKSHNPEGLARLKARAASLGGQCLDDVYEGRNAKYRFRCKKGHEWRARGHLVLSRTWCPVCANQAKMSTIEEMREVAHRRGGRCLSEEYLGNWAKLSWECGLGHVWESLPRTIVSGGAWCPNCYRLRVTRNPDRRRRYEVHD